MGKHCANPIERTCKSTFANKFCLLDFLFFCGMNLNAQMIMVVVVVLAVDVRKDGNNVQTIRNVIQFAVVRILLMI